MSIAATRAPSRTKRSTPARPMPDAAAVTAASLPSRRICLSLRREGVGEPPRRRYDGGLGFEEGVEPFDTVLAAPAAGLDAAIGGRPADVAIGVDPHPARLDPRRTLVRAARVRRPPPRGEPQTTR